MSRVDVPVLTSRAQRMRTCERHRARSRDCAAEARVSMRTHGQTLTFIPYVAIDSRAHDQVNVTESTSRKECGIAETQQTRNSFRTRATVRYPVTNPTSA